MPGRDTGGHRPVRRRGCPSAARHLPRWGTASPSQLRGSSSPMGSMISTDDPVVVEGGQALPPPMLRWSTGEGPQDVAAIGAVVAVWPPTDAPWRAGFVGERPGVVRPGRRELRQLHVLDGEEERRGLAGLLDSQRGRGLGHELARPPGAGHQRARSPLRRVAGRSGCGPDRSGLRSVGQGRSRRPPGSRAPAPECVATAASLGGPPLQGLLTRWIAMVREYCAAVCPGFGARTRSMSP